MLRRLAENLKAQNWTAIGIEFVLLVLGVFLGIQVANWNEGRIEEQRARDFLVRLSGDLEQELASIDQRLAYVGQSIEYGEQALAWAEDGTLAQDSAWQTVLAFFQASRILPYSPVDITYQEMRSAGELRLVRNAALRSALTEYYVSGTLPRADYILRLNPEYRGHVRGLTPHRIARHISTACFDIADIRTVTTRPCEAPIDDASALAILERYRAAPGLMTELAYWIDSAHLKIAILRQLRTACIELKQRIDDELAH
jgi:hypothetical protein